MKTRIYTAILALIGMSCAPRTGVMLEEVTLTSNSAGTRPVYRASEPLPVDPFHTELELRVDWESEAIDGVARITFSPRFYPLSEVELDAVGMEIKSVAQLVDGQQPQPLEYDYNGERIRINLPQTLTSKDTSQVQITYRAEPSKLKVQGSSAIRDARGMYFINASGRNPHKPTQIWTQGETEANSCWFPTFDQPNAKMTQEIYLYVDTALKTLSNGTLAFSQALGNGKRLDYWRQDQPQAPYLTFLGVGDFAVVSEKWNEREVSYWVEPEYASSAAEIFARTPEMLTFFSEITGVDYPWDKYAQIVVRDFVSGAMENTTAVVFNESLLGNEQSFNDRKNDQIIAHEMFHHWFGDLVTCESWSNIALNESFATYGEYLWWDYTYGRDEADWVLQQKKNAYISTYQRGVRANIVRYDYASQEDLFDVHSYSKGGCVLHMLRNYLGDAAFFEGMRLYLTQNAYGSAELADLRLVYEDLVGEDLNWFFNQWFLDDGHPILDVSYRWDEEAKVMQVDVKQSQDLAQHQIFDLPTTVDFYLGTRRISYPIRIQKAEQSFFVDLPGAPDWMQLDGKHALLAEIREHRDNATFWAQWEKGIYFMDRWKALQVLMQKRDFASIDRWVEGALGDPAHQIRMVGLEMAESITSEKSNLWMETVLGMASNDPHTLVRAKAAEVLDKRYSGFDSQLYYEWLNDTSYAVAAAALRAVERNDPNAAYEFAKDQMNTCDGELEWAIADILSQRKEDPSVMDFFVPRLQKMGMSDFVRMGGLFQEYLYFQSPEIQEVGAAIFRDQAMELRPAWVSNVAYAYLTNLYEWVSQEGIKSKIGLMRSQVDELRSNE